MYRRPPVPPLPAPVFPYPTLVRPSGSRFGFATGLTSQIAHAGGPPFQMWVTPRRLPHLVFIGTSSVLFALINWLKVPAYLALGAFPPEVVVAALLLLPPAIVPTLLPVRWMKRIRSEGRRIGEEWD